MDPHNNIQPIRFAPGDECRILRPVVITSRIPGHEFEARGEVFYHDDRAEIPPMPEVPPFEAEPRFLGKPAGVFICLCVLFAAFVLGAVIFNMRMAQ